MVIEDLWHVLAHKVFGSNAYIVLLLGDAKNFKEMHSNLKPI